MPNDYVEINSGSGGAYVGVDSIGAIQYQIVKLGIGSDGTIMQVGTGQQTSINSIPVVLPSDQLPLAVAQSGNWNVNVANTSLAYNVTASIVSAINVANTSLSYLVTAAQSGPWTVAVSNTGGQVTQGGAWNVSSTIVNSAGWLVNVANTLGLYRATSTTIINSAGWLINVANTLGLYRSVSAEILNSVSIANTSLIYTVSANVINTPNVSVTSLTQGKTLKRAVINQNATDSHIVNAVVGSTINVTSILLSAGAPNVATFTQGSQGPSLTGPIYLALSGGFVAAAPADHSAAWLQVNAGTGLNLHLAAAGSVGGCITYYEG